MIHAPTMTETMTPAMPIRMIPNTESSMPVSLIRANQVPAALACMATMPERINTAAMAAFSKGMFP